MMTIVESNTYEFQQWFEVLPLDLKEKMKDFFNEDDPRTKIIRKEIRKDKIESIEKYKLWKGICNYCEKYNYDPLQMYDTIIYIKNNIK